MKTYKQYAQEHGISYNAVYQSVQAHKKELKGHLHKRGRVTFLDEEAENILDSYRKGNPVVVLSEETVSRIDQLEAENKELRDKLQAIQEKYINDVDQLRQRVDLLTADKMQLLEDKAAAEEAKSRSLWRRLFGN